MEKKCTKCEQVKSLDEFPNNKNRRDGKDSRCKSCKNRYNEIKRSKNPLCFNMILYSFNPIFSFVSTNQKKCTKCKVVKNLDKFTGAKNTKSGKHSSCKSCAIKYVIKNKDKMDLYKEKRKHKKKLYREKNKEHQSNIFKVWRIKNKEKINERTRNRKKTDFLFKLRCNISSNINNSLRIKGYSKNTKTSNILKCEYNFFIKWLNGLASNGYTYGIGELHLDHVVPISLAETEHETLLLNHYSNFQLLTGNENVTKGNRYVNPLNLARVLEHHPNPDKIREIHARL
jgi:hypothetical protein